jgi:cell division protein FtsI (penicillin-binding protein 3)
MITTPDKKRLICVALTIFILFSFLIAQFYHVQIIEGEKWAQKAQRQHFFVVKEPFIRGAFYSNPYIKKGHPAEPQSFMIDVPKYHLYADPLSIPFEYKNEIADWIVEKLALNSNDAIHLLEQMQKKSHSRKLALWIGQEDHQELLQWWKLYAKKRKIPRNALFFIKDYQRSYPFGKMLGQVLHTIQMQKDEFTNQALPTGGLELYFNEYLKGKQGKRRLMRSPLNSLEIGEVIAYPEHGADIYLTINTTLQAIAEEEIEKGVKRTKAKGGWAVMMDPYTGEILALAQYPFFYLDDYQRYFNDPELIEHTKVKAVTDANEPGSVLKPFTVALALKANKILKERGEKELFTPEEKIATSSGRFPGRTKPITDTSLHYYLNMDMAMQKSSNIYMARLAERMVSRLGNDWYRRQLQLFGFGLKTFVELPAESSGVLPTPGKLHPNGALEWSVPTPFSLAFGHNLQVNTIQMVRAYSVLANGGFLVQPTLIRKIVKKTPNGEEVVIVDYTSEERRKQFPRIFDQDIIDRVLRSMRYVTKPGGTATRADVPGYTEVGKTSTPKKIVNGRYSERLYCPLFTGFCPVNRPSFVMAVVIDEPEYGFVQGLGKVHNGGNCTGIVFREIAKRSLEYLGITPDDPHGYPYGDPRYDSNKVEWMAETRKLQEMYNTWNKGQEISKK